MARRSMAPLSRVTKLFTTLIETPKVVDLFPFMAKEGLAGSFGSRADESNLSLASPAVPQEADMGSARGESEACAHFRARGTFSSLTKGYADRLRPPKRRRAIRPIVRLNGRFDF